jgi:putative flippase GtrA
MLLENFVVGIVGTLGNFKVYLTLSEILGCPQLVSEAS